MISSLPTDETSYKYVLLDSEKFKRDRVINTKKLLESDLKQHGSDIQALFVNINWSTTHSPDGIKIDDFV